MDIQLILDLTETPGLNGKRRREVAALIRQFNSRSIPLKVSADSKVGDINVDHAILLPFPEGERDNIMYVRMKKGQKEIDLHKTFTENGLSQGAMVRVYAMVK